MSGIRSRGRDYGTLVPNWWPEDQRIDPYEFRIAVWIASHSDDYRADHVTRNEIARRTGISAERAGRAVLHLAELGIIELAEAPSPNGGRPRWIITFDKDVWNARPEGCPAPSVEAAPQPSKVAPQPSPIDQQTDRQLQVVPYTPTDGFDTFWSRYPRREGKQDAVRAWKRALRLTGTTAILQGLDARVEWWRASETPQQFIPLPATWLNGERWNDELGPPTRDRRPGVRPSIMAQVERLSAWYDEQTGDPASLPG